MKLTDYLKKTGISQKEFGAKVGVTQSMVWQWINNKRRIAAENVIPIESATEGNVSRHDLRPDIYPR
jgi:DNA-binding transcriptional regulator YdaS (Cro superfamily)